MPLLTEHAGRLADPFLVSRTSAFGSLSSCATMTIPTSNPCTCPCPCPLRPCSVTAFMSCSHGPSCLLNVLCAIMFLRSRSILSCGSVRHERNRGTAPEQLPPIRPYARTSPGPADLVDGTRELGPVSAPRQQQVSASSRPRNGSGGTWGRTRPNPPRDVGVSVPARHQHL